MTSKNEHTGALMNTKAATDLYREGYERIFGNKKKVTAPVNAPNSPIVGDGYRMREMLDRKWVQLPANLREGCTAHVDGVGDV